MPLELYNSDREQVSSGGLFTNPVRTFHDGKGGSVYTCLLYIRNSDNNFYYESVRLRPKDSSGYDDTVGEYGTGFSVKLSYGSVEPKPHEWQQINSGVVLSLPSSIGTSSMADVSTYYPVWLRVAIPGNQSAQVKEDISLVLSYVKRPTV